jgi:hypothetical protein
MSQTLQSFLWLIFDTIGPIALGYVLHVRGLVTREQTQALIAFNVRVMYTLLAFLSFWRLNITAELVWVVPVSLFLYFFPYWTGLFMSRGLKDPAERGPFVISAMLGNVGSVGGLMSFLILGQAGFAVSQIATVVQTMLLVVFCFPVCQRYSDQASAGNSPVRRRSLRELLLTWNQISVVGMVLGGVFSVCSVHQPESLSTVFTALIHVACWINFLPAGLLIDFKGALPYMRLVSSLIPVKFLLAPAVIWAICEVVFNDPLITKTLVILAATPTAINAVLSSALYGLKKDVAIASFISTSVLFCFIVGPALFLLLS